MNTKRIILLFTWLTASVIAARAERVVVEPTPTTITPYGTSTALQYISVYRANLPGFGNQITITSDIGNLTLALIGGKSGSEGTYLTYTVTHNGNASTLTAEDNISTSGTNGMYLPSSQNSIAFSSGTTISFCLTTKSNENYTDLDDSPSHRVIVFTINDVQGLFVACDDDGDWDYNDRVFWISQANVNAVAPATTISLADASDNTSVLNANSGQTRNVTLSGRTFYRDGKWNTLCLPFSLSAAQLASIDCPLKGATIKTLSESAFSESTGELTINFADASEVEAGKPYIVKWDDAANLANPTFWNVAIPAENPSTTFTVSTTYVDFKGILSPYAIPGEDKTMLYLGGNNTLYYPNAAMTLNACRAYFQLKGITAGDPTSGVRALVLDFGDETSGIQTLNHEPKTVNQYYYDLSGRRLNAQPTQKGIYIYHGHQIVIK